jgi:hypothetical protein
VLAQRLGKPPSYVANTSWVSGSWDLLEYLDIAAAIGFDPSEPIRSLLSEQPLY